MSEPTCPRRTLTLSAQERADLEQIRDRDPRAYLRERAAALLKIADGCAPHFVARHGLHKPRNPQTVYIWLNYYEANRTLAIRPPCRGKGFSPRGTGGSVRDGAAIAPAAPTPA